MAQITDNRRPAPFRVAVHFEGKTGLILLDQIRALDKPRLIKRLGRVDAGTLRMILGRLQDVFAE